MIGQRVHGRIGAAIAFANRVRRFQPPGRPAETRPEARPLRQAALPVPAVSGGGGPAMASFLLAVVLPAAAAAVYFFAIAADRYEASARFVVREPMLVSLAAPDASVETPRLGGGLGADAPSALAHVAAVWLRSRAAVEDMSGRLDLDALFRRPEADFLSRLPEDASAETRLAFWRSRVDAVVDGPSGVVTLRVRAFRPGDATTLAQALLDRLEEALDGLAARRKRDALARAEADAALARRRFETAVAEMTGLRENEGLLDPGLEAEAAVGALASLMARRMEIETELRGLDGALAAGAPKMRALAAQRAEIDRALAALRDGLAGGGGESLAAARARFEILDAERRFAERLLEITERRLIETQIDLERRSVYLHVFDPPQAPEEARYPRRAGYAALAAAGLFVVWAIVALIWASVRDHRIA